ncbi:MAG: Gp15 family bacteriophage protein [Angelakisella sp.]
MNPLSDRLPGSVLVQGQVCPVNSDWRSCMRIILAFEDAELTLSEQMELMIELLYQQPPPQCAEALEQAVRFLNCGERQDKRPEGEPAARLFRFAADGKLIYAAFRKSHGIDLGTAALHWWEFCWLFLELREDCSFCRLLALRERRRKGKLTAEERRQLERMDPQSAPEYNAQERELLEDFLTAMNGGNGE